VAGEIVHDDYVAWLERWHQDLVDIGLEPITIDGTIKCPSSKHLAQIGL